MLMRKSNHPQLLRAAVCVQLNHLHFLTASKNNNRRLSETQYALSGGAKSAAQVSAHHGATGENGLEMNRNPLMCLESEGRGGGDGWDIIHPLLQSEESEKHTNTDATLKL